MTEERPKHKRTYTGLTASDLKHLEARIPPKAKEIWDKFQITEFDTKEEFETNFIRHVETTLARSLYNVDELSAYQAASNTVRDNLLVNWNKTQQKQTAVDKKRVYYFSMEFLMGRALDNSLINLGVRDLTEASVKDLGFRLEDLIETEPDAALGNGGLGRLAACFVDSLSTGDFPAWGYGLNYQYGIFAQKIINGYQVEAPDYWLKFNNPWIIERSEIQVPIDFYGSVERTADSETGDLKVKWIPGERVLAVPCDFPIPGYGTKTVNNLRLWSCKPTMEFDFNKFNSGDYQNSVLEQQKAESITSVLYPNDNFNKGKELRLKQQYFWCAASLHDIIRRFKKTNRNWSEFPDQVAIQLNDTHPTLAIVELQRVLVDLENIPWDDAWAIVTKTFGYTNHTVMLEALEKWPVPVFGSLLPRHLEIIYEINWLFLEFVRQKFPDDEELLGRVSIVEEGGGKQIRMAFLAIVGSHNVNGVAELHSELIKTTIFKDFVKIFGADRFTNVTNGITPRRWLRQANPQLSELIASKLGGYEYLTKLSLLKSLEKFIDDKEFLKKWDEIKVYNKNQLTDLIKSTTGVEVSPTALFDVQVKRIHEYKRQQMNIFGVIHKYIQLKKASPEERKKFQQKVSIFGGKAAPGYYMAKNIIKLINAVGEVINNDPEIGDYLKCVFIPDYNVSKAELITPASDISEHISTAGTEASGTSNMKFVLNGGLIIGTVDGANVEITREIGEENIFLFGTLAENVEEIRIDHKENGVNLPESLADVFKTIESGEFGDADEYKQLIDSVKHYDYYLVSDDFESYLQAHANLEDEYKRDHFKWLQKSVTSVANMGFFSSDRCIEEYAESIWNIEPFSS